VITITCRLFERSIKTLLSLYSSTPSTDKRYHAYIFFEWPYAGLSGADPRFSKDLYTGDYSERVEHQPIRGVCGRSGAPGAETLVRSRESFLYTFIQKRGPEVNIFNVLSGFCCESVIVFCITAACMASASPWSMGMSAAAQSGHAWIHQCVAYIYHTSP